MQLRSVSVRNIRSFESATLPLTSGTTLLVGDVGAGKSSLLYAIEMALFGVAEVEAAYLVRHGEGSAEVTVTLGEAEHRYEISRSFRRVRRSGRETFVPEAITFTSDGRTTSYSATELRQRVIELVGFPDNPNPKAHSDLWRWAVYVPQERMREILAAKPEERLETIRKALGVERFRLAAENAQTLAADLKADARRLREEAGRLAYWDEEHDKALREHEELSRRGDRARADLSALQLRLEQGRAALAELDRQLAGLAADRRERDTLARDQAAADRTLREAAHHGEQLAAELRRAENELTAATQAAQGREALEGALAGSDRFRREAEEELARVEGVLRELAAERVRAEATARAATEAGRRVDRARSGLADARRTAEAARAEGPTHEPPAPTPRSLATIEQGLEEARHEEKAAVERLGRLKSEDAAVAELVERGVCPTCHQSVRSDAFGEHRKEVAAQRAAGEQQLATAMQRREALDSERKSRERFERAHERWVELERRRAELDKSVATWETELAAAEAAVAGSSTSGPSRAEIEGRWDSERRRAEALRSSAELRRAEHARSTSALAEVARAEERAARLADELVRTRQEIERSGRQLEERRREAAARAARLSEIDGRLAGFAATEKERKELVEALATQEAQVTAARTAVAATDARRESLSERIALAERGRADRAARVAEATALDAKAEWVAGPLRYHLLAMEKDILSHAQAVFDRSFSRFFAALLDDPGMIARTDATFTPQVTINGEDTPAEALSGGERTGLALAFRLALAHTVRSLGEVRLESLLLDEPTDGFSAEQVVRMGELLEELALPQVVVVSHEAQLAGIADRTVRVVKSSGSSELVGLPDRGGADLEGFTAEPDGPDDGPGSSS